MTHAWRMLQVGRASEANIKNFGAWFDCAKQIEKWQQRSPDQVCAHVRRQEHATCLIQQAQC